MRGGNEGGEIASIRLSLVGPAEREALIRSYRQGVYEPAFPDASIREDPRYWLDLLNSAEYPPSPQPLIDVVLLTTGDDVVAGVTVEYYRAARCGLLTYISVHPSLRERGLGRRLVAAARATLDAMAEPGVLMFAETERLEDARDPGERKETMLRQVRLTKLGARLVDFDYMMPALRPDSEPHRLHLMVFDPDRSLDTVAANDVAALMRELAAALGADLAADRKTAAMMAILDQGGLLPVVPLPGALGVA